MSRKLDDLLDYEVRRRPELAALVANLANLTEAEIETAPLPLPWMRQALLVKKRALLAISFDRWITAGHTPDPVGEMRRWTSSDSFVRVGRSQLEIHYGQLIWREADGAVWIDSIRSQTIDPTLIQHTISCGYVRRSEYMEAVRTRCRQLVPQEIALEPMERVRFYRP